MAIKADMKYNGTVRAGSALTESMGTGTMAFQVMLECEDGDTSFSIWLTDKNRERAVKYFAALGVPAEKLSDAHFIEYELAGAIEGMEVCFGTKEEEYKGRKQIKVAWIGKKSEALAGSLTMAAAAFFGGNGPAAGAKPAAETSSGAKIESDNMEEDSIPF